MDERKGSREGGGEAGGREGGRDGGSPAKSDNQLVIYTMDSASCILGWGSEFRVNNNVGF